MARNLYLNTAKYYDFEMAGDPLSEDEIAFFVGRAQEAAGAILELGCGTGRVTIPIARSGKPVWGLDLSPAMLARFQERLQQEERPVRERIHLVQGDLADFELGRRFELIIIPYRSFSVLTSEAERRACLERVARHLRPGGRFILELHHYPPLSAGWIGREERQWSRLDPDSGKFVSKTSEITAIDFERGVLEVTFRIKVLRPGNEQLVLADDFSFAALRHEEVRRLLEDCGFVVLEEMGYFDGRPVGEGSELVYVCGTS